MEFLKPAASPPSAWSAPHLYASSAYSRRRAPFLLGLLAHGPAAVVTGTAPLVLARAAGALAPISSTSSPSWKSAAKDLPSLHRPEVAAACTRSLAARLQVLLCPIPSGCPAAVDARLPELKTYRGRARLLPLRALPGSGYLAAAAEARLPALETYHGRPRLPPLRALPGSFIPGRRRDVSHARSRCTAEEGASTADKKTEQSERVKKEHMLVFSVVILVRYAEAHGIPTLISNNLKLPDKMTAVLVFLFMAVKFVYKALKETKDIEGVLNYFRKIVKQGAPPVEDKDGAAKP